MDWLLISGGGMEHDIVVHKPAVEIAVTGRNAREVLILERPFVQQFLPHSVVGREIDVLEKLTVEHRIYESRRFVRLYSDFGSFLSQAAECNAEGRN